MFRSLREFFAARCAACKQRSSSDLDCAACEQFRREWQSYGF